MLLPKLSNVLPNIVWVLIVNAVITYDANYSRKVLMMTSICETCCLLLGLNDVYYALQVL